MSTHQLQVNNSGAWKTVLRFDGSDARKREWVRTGASLLSDASSGATSYRIASCDRQPVVLSYMGTSTYGIWIDNKGA